MTYQDDEGSVEHSQPREAVKITMGTQVFRLALGDEDLVIAGESYVASTCDRTESGVSLTGAYQELSIILPCDHPVPLRMWPVPPRRIDVILWRQQLRSGESRAEWRGRATSCSISDDGKTARLLVPSRLAQTLGRKLPVFTAGKNCPHVLYAEGTCRANRLDFVESTTVVSVDSILVVVAALPTMLDPFAAWAKFGKITDVDSGQWMGIVDVLTANSVGTNVQLVLEAPLRELAPGRTVSVDAGCNHLLDDCFGKFRNQVNYGGKPELPTAKPHAPTGLGILEVA